MAKGICSSCGRDVGGFMKPPAWTCKSPKCKNNGELYCDKCGLKVGLFYKKPVCPICKRELQRT